MAIKLTEEGRQRPFCLLMKFKPCVCNSCVYMSVCMFVCACDSKPYVHHRRSCPISDTMPVLFFFPVFPQILFFSSLVMFSLHLFLYTAHHAQMFHGLTGLLVQIRMFQQSASHSFLLLEEHLFFFLEREYNDNNQAKTSTHKKREHFKLLNGEKTGKKNLVRVPKRKNK